MKSFSLCVCIAMLVAAHPAAAATVSGTVVRHDNGAPVVGAIVRYGAVADTTDALGQYSILALAAGSYDARVTAPGHWNRRRTVVLVEGANTQHDTLTASTALPGLTGLWLFDDAQVRTFGTAGKDLTLAGSALPITDAFGGGGVNIGIGSFYRCAHDIPTNGGGSYVNRWTVVMDIRVPQLGRWYSLLQTNAANSNDAELFIQPSGTLGVAATGYSSYALQPGQWYRLAVSVALGGHYTYYLDGHLLLEGVVQPLDGRFSLEPASGLNQVLFFADENGEDNAIDVGEVGIYSRDLGATEVAQLGGFGHDVSPPYVERVPFLQSPTDHSQVVCWHDALSTITRVEYGLTPALGQSTTGTSEVIGGAYRWHTVRLTGLQPDTRYHYRVVSGGGTSATYQFRTAPAANDPDRFRLLLLSDTHSDNPADMNAVIAAARATLDSLGEGDLLATPMLIVHSGDLVMSGSTATQYASQFLAPLAPLSPWMATVTTPGNHDIESANYYAYVKYDSVSGFPSTHPLFERVWSMKYANTQIVSLNSNLVASWGVTQAMWLQSTLAAAEADPDVDFVLCIVHHPPFSELWLEANQYDAGPNWVRDQLLPLLRQSSKVVALAYGHTHGYERGTIADASGVSGFRIVCGGGGGGDTDRWGEFGNLDDPRIHVAHDHHFFQLVEVDPTARTWDCTMVSLGHTDRPRAAEPLDRWHRRRDQPAPPAPLALAAGAPAGETVRFTASPYDGADAWMSSQFQLTSVPGDWASPLVDQARDWKDVYGDDGGPTWNPVDWNAALDLRRLTVPAATFVAGHEYGWRVRYRDQNLQWSAWSSERPYVHAAQPVACDFAADLTSGTAPLRVRFSDLSVGTATHWSWDFDGDGQADSDAQDPEHLYTTPGAWTVRLTVTIAGSPCTLARTAYVNVTPPAGTPPAPGVRRPRLAPGRPNPARGSSSIEFELPSAGPVRLCVYGVDGRQARTLVSDAWLEPGVHHRELRTNGLAPGVYLCRLSACGEVTTRRLVVLR